MNRTSLLFGVVVLIATSFVLPVSSASAGEIEEFLIWLGLESRNRRTSSASVGESVVTDGGSSQANLSVYMSSEAEAAYSPVYDHGGDKGSLTEICITPVGDELDEGKTVDHGSPNAPVPEPLTLLLFSVGGGAAIFARRRRRSASAFR